MIYATIRIMQGDSQTNCEWDETEGDMEVFIKDQCYGAVDTNAKALVYVEVLRQEPRSRLSGSNFPDGEMEEPGKVTKVDDLVFMYDDQKDTLSIIRSNIVHKSLPRLDNR